MNNLAPMKNCPEGARLPKFDTGVVVQSVIGDFSAEVL